MTPQVPQGQAHTRLQAATQAVKARLVAMDVSGALHIDAVAQAQIAMGAASAALTAADDYAAAQSAEVQGVADEMLAAAAGGDYNPGRIVGTLEDPSRAEIREITDSTVLGQVLERGDIGDTVKVKLNADGLRYFMARVR